MAGADKPSSKTLIHSHGTSYQIDNETYPHAKFPGKYATFRQLSASDTFPTIDMCRIFAFTSAVAVWFETACFFGSGNAGLLAARFEAFPNKAAEFAGAGHAAMNSRNLSSIFSDFEPVYSPTTLSPAITTKCGNPETMLVISMAIVVDIVNIPLKNCQTVRQPTNENAHMKNRTKKQQQW